MIITWTYGSVRYHFDSMETRHFFNGEEVPADASKWVQINIFGPQMEQLGNSDTRVSVMIDFIINVGGSNDDVFAVHRIADSLKAMLTDISVKRLGGGDNDNADIYCLALQNPTTYYYVGPIEDKIKVNRAVLKAVYCQTVSNDVIAGTASDEGET